MSRDKAHDDPPDGAMKSGTDKPWKKPGQSSQNENQAPSAEPDIERWQDSNTH
jgi:hypothetical protein